MAGLQTSYDLTLPLDADQSFATFNDRTLYGAWVALATTYDVDRHLDRDTDAWVEAVTGLFNQHVQLGNIRASRTYTPRNVAEAMSPSVPSVYALMDLSFEDLELEPLPSVPGLTLWGYAEPDPSFKICCG